MSELKITEQYNVGHAKYVVNFCCGKKHADGSDFYDIRIFSNKREKEKFLKRLQEPVRLLECGCCGQFHPEGPLLPGGSANYKNDCRYDANRFSSDEDFTQRLGLPAVEVWLDKQEL